MRGGNTSPNRHTKANYSSTLIGSMLHPTTVTALQ